MSTLVVGPVESDCVLSGLCSAEVELIPVGAHLGELPDRGHVYSFVQFDLDMGCALCATAYCHL